MTNKSILKLWQESRERNSGILLAATGSDVVDVDLPVGTEQDRKVLKEIFGTDLYISGSQFREQLEAISSDEVIVRYNSPGGVATEGAAMRQAVIDAREQGRTVIGLGAGSIASAVTLPFMASTERVMGDSSLLLLHEARMMYMLFQYGATADVIEKDREMLQSRISSLKTINEAQTNIILDITDRDEDAVKNLLGEDREMGATEALDWKLIDRIDQPPKTEEPEPENRNRTPILLHKPKETDMNEAELAKEKEDSEVGERPTPTTRRSWRMTARLSTWPGRVHARRPCGAGRSVSRRQDHPSRRDQEKPIGSRERRGAVETTASRSFPTSRFTIPIPSPKATAGKSQRNLGSLKRRWTSTPCCRRGSTKAQPTSRPTKRYARSFLRTWKPTRRPIRSTGISTSSAPGGPMGSAP